MAKQNLSKHFLSDLLQTFPETGRYWVAYSGGIDSRVLLHLLGSIRNDIKSAISAIHVNHRINPDSGNWSDHCRQVCKQAGIPFHNVNIDTTCPAGESLENWARKERYRAIAGFIEQDDILLMAHNRDDQAETVLLQIMRGSGPRGLAAMPVIRKFCKGLLARPLLDFSREQIRCYAVQHQLEWIDDLSNRDINYDRNYIRMIVLPILLNRWPGSKQVLTRVAGHQSEIAAFLDETAASDLENVHRKDINALDIAEMKAFPDARVKNLIGYWLKQQNLKSPGSAHLDKILTDILNSSADAVPCVKWPGTEVRRYRNLLFAQEPLPPHNPGQRIEWNMENPLGLALGNLEACRTKGQGISVDACRDSIMEVRFRRGGEKLRPAGRRDNHELKKLFQEHGVLPWYRNRVPLLYIRNQLAAVADLWVGQEYAAERNQESWQIKWTGAGKIAIGDGTLFHGTHD